MSRAFVKEGDGALDPLPDIPIGPHPNHVTPRGLASLQARLAEAQVRLAAAKARADRLDRLPEAAAERDIRYLEARLRSAIVVDPVGHDLRAVAFGLCVTVRDEAGEARTYEIVGEDEADAGVGRIAPQSPLARALLGAEVGDEVGDEVVWRRPAGAVRLEVVGIGRGQGARITTTN